MSLVIEPLRFAKKSSVMSGTLNDFPRLIDNIISSAKVDYKLAGQSSVEDYRLILTLSGQVSAVCQRCLEPMVQDIAFVKQYRLTPENQIDNRFDEEMLADEETELLAIGQAIDLIELIEDELLLAVPTIPKHDDCELVISN